MEELYCLRGLAAGEKPGIKRMEDKNGIPAILSRRTAES